MIIKLNIDEIWTIKSNLNYLINTHSAGVLDQEIETIKNFIEKLENAEIEAKKESMCS